MERTQRIIKAINLMARPQGATIEEFQSELGLSRRSVYRLLDTLKDQNFPLISQASEEGRMRLYRLEATYLAKLPNLLIPGLTLNSKEALVLSGLLNRGHHLTGTAWDPVVDSIKSKLERELASKEFDSTNSPVSELFLTKRPPAKTWKGSPQIIEDLASAALNKQVVNLHYQSFRSDTDHRWSIWPLRFLEHHEGLFLFAYIAEIKNVRLLALERVKTWKTTERTFVPSQVDYNSILDSSFGIIFDTPLEVRIRFSKATAKYVSERTWVPNQILEWKEDGSLELVFTASGRQEILRWVLGFGPQAKILSPKDLQQEAHESLVSTLSKYEN